MTDPQRSDRYAGPATSVKPADISPLTGEPNPFGDRISVVADAPADEADALLAALVEAVGQHIDERGHSDALDAARAYLARREAADE